MGSTPASNRGVARLTELHRSFPQPVRQNANTVLEIKSQSCPSKSIPVHYSPTIPPLDSKEGVCKILKRTSRMSSSQKK